MAIFGGGVRPEPVRTDYSQVAQGGQLAGQMAARGSEMMASGLAQALAGAGAAVNNYIQAKEQRAFKEQTVSNLSAFLKDNPSAAKELGFNIDPNDKKQIEAAVKGFGGGDFNKGSALASQLIQNFGAQKSQQTALQQALASGGGGDYQSMAQALLGAGAGVGPTSAMVSALSGAAQVPTEKDTRTTTQKEYDLAVQEGFQGSFMDFQKQLAEAERPTTNINMPAQNALLAELGKKEAENVVGLIEKADKAEIAINKLDRVLDVLEEGNLNAGIGATVFTNIDRIRSKFLDDLKAGKRVENDQIIDAFLGSDVFPLIGELGIGARGIDTPAERDFLISVFTGKRDLNLETLKQMTKYRREAAERNIANYNKALERGRLDPVFEVSPGFSKQPREIPKRAPKSSGSIFDDADRILGLKK